jgi:hypothetical protein
MQQIATTGSGFLNSLLLAFNGFMSYIPTLLGALIVLGVGWYISKALALILEKGLFKLGLERAAAHSGLNDFIAKSGTNVTTSHVVAQLLKWMIFLVFIQAATNLLGMPQVSAIITSVVLFVPKLVVAMVIVILGAMLASFLARMVQGMAAEANVGNPVFLANLAKYFVIGLAVISAFSEIDLASVIVNSLFIALIGSVALAVGLAFGLGGRDAANELTRKWLDASKQRASNTGATPPPLRNVSSEVKPKVVVNK